MTRSLVCIIAIAATSAHAADPSRVPSVTAGDPDSDQVKVTATKAGCLVAITSPSGIGKTALTRTTDKWPTAVVLRLHLKGLEGFKASNSTVTVGAEVPNSGGKPRTWQDVEGKEKPIEMSVKAVDGHFEIRLPPAILAADAKTITVQWIDFYRN